MEAYRTVTKKMRFPEMTGFDEIDSVWLSGYTALAQVFGIALSIYLVDRVGRRTLVLTSLFMVTISLVGLGMSFYLARTSSSRVTYASPTCGTQPATIWNGVTKYCYDCVNIDGCGFCANGACVRGNDNGPFSKNACAAYPAAVPLLPAVERRQYHALRVGMQRACGGS